jgi:uracil-DNA glycosylase
MSQTADLGRLWTKIRACRICSDAPVGAPLPQEPRPVLQPSSVARILIAGQAPGLRVQESGVPFDDRSGDRLRDWLGVDRKQFYNLDNFAILPMGFCFPGYNASGHDLPPRRECAPAWRQSILDLMPQIDLVLLVGGYAQAWHLGDAARPGVNETVAAWRSIYQAGDTRRQLPLPHPSWRNTAWLNRNPWFETDLLPMLRREVKARIL